MSRTFGDDNEYPYTPDAKITAAVTNLHHMGNICFTLNLHPGVLIHGHESIGSNGLSICSRNARNTTAVGLWYGGHQASQRWVTEKIQRDDDNIAKWQGFLILKNGSSSAWLFKKKIKGGRRTHRHILIKRTLVACCTMLGLALIGMEKESKGKEANTKVWYPSFPLRIGSGVFLCWSPGVCSPNRWKNYIRYPT